MAPLKANRIRCFDALKALAAYWIFIGHYISDFMPQYEVLWDEGNILCGLSGKLALALFSVLLGYFAAAKKRTAADVPSYIIRRYLQFSIPLLVVTTLSALGFFVRREAGLTQLAAQILSQSLLFQDGYLCHPAWCIPELFAASVIIVLLRSRNDTPYTLTAVMAFSLITKNVWAAVCIMGALVFLLNERFASGVWEKGRRLLFHPVSKILLAVIAFCIIRRPIGYVTFILDGISSSIVVLLFLNSSTLQRLFSWRPLAALGGISFEVFLLHHPLSPLFHGIADRVLTPYVSQDLRFFLTLLFTMVCITCLAWLFHRLLNTRLFRLPYRFFDSNIPE